MASNRSLQLLRNNTLFNTLADAKAAMSANTVTTQDGVAVLGRYGSGDDIKTVLGIKHVVSGVTGMTFFENSNETSELIAKLQKELDDTQAGAGLNADGSFAGPSGGTWTSGATTLAEAIEKLEEGLANISTGTVSGDSKVVIDVTQDKGKITATSANLTGVKLDGYTVGGDDSGKVADTDTLGQALGKLQGQINGMDLTAVGTEGSVITSVSEEDGKVSAAATPIKDVKLTGYVKDTTKTGDIAATDDIEDALSKLENKAAAITIKNDDGSIKVTTDATGPDINVNIKSGEKVIKKDGDAGLYTDLDLVKITTGLPAEVKERYQLLASDDSQIGVNIDIAKDSHIVSITYITDSEDTHYQNLEYVYIDASGNTKTEYVDMNSLILEAEFASGITVTEGIAHGVVDPDSEKNSGETASFLTVGENGFKVDGIKQEIINRINELDVTDTAADGQYVSAVNETDGKIAVTRANVSEAVLNNYAKGTDATAVTSADTVNQAISKLENQVDKAKAAATTKVVEGTDAGNNLEISSATSETDGSTTYTINLTDVASKAALDAEIAARKAVDGQDGQAYAANTSATYISGATSLNDADVKLDAALKALDGDAIKTITSSNGSIGVTSGANSFDLATDTSKIKLSGFTPTTATTDTAPQNGDTLSDALAAIYAVAKHHHLTASNSGVTVATTTDGTTVGLNLDEASTAPDDREDGTYAHPQSKNVLSVDSEGLYLSNVWDCGTYDVVEP